MNTKNILFTIGGPETTAGTAVSLTHVLPIRERPGFRDQAEKMEDPAITGVNMVIAEYLAARNLSGPLPLSPRPCAGFGKLLNSLLGQESTPAQIGAIMRIRYGGSEDSAKISASTSADTLTSEVGDLGSESGDTNFGTSGVIDLTDTATDTVSELVSVIDAYDDYEAELVTGSGSIDAADIINITEAQGKGRWVYVFFSSATTSLYLHQWPVDLTNTQRKTYTVQADGIHDNFLAAGVVIDQMSISGALKAMIEAEAQALGFTFTAGQSAQELELEAVDPFLFYSGSFSLNGVAQPFIRNISFDIMNNHNADGYGMGSASRQYHDKGMFGVTSQLQVRYSADIYALYAKVFNNLQAGLDVYFTTPGYIGTASDLVKGLLIIEAPYCNVTDYDTNDNAGVLDATMNLRIVNPSSGYGSPFRISMITDDSGAY